MVTVMVTHGVKNYPDWKRAFDSQSHILVKAEAKLKGVYCSVDNNKHITVIAEIANVDAANKFLSSPELKAAMEESGVTSKPEIKILNKMQ